MAKFVSNENKSVRMFKSDLLESFSHIHPATPWVIFAPVVAFMFYYALVRQGQSLVSVAGGFALGLLLWSFIEYSLHRWIFHYEPKSEWGKRIHFIMHGVHHDYPNDATRLVMPPVLSIPLGIFFFSLYALLFGGWATGVFAGTLCGYLAYDTLHYASHHLPMRSGILRWLKQYHLRHHYHDDHTGYGVSSPLWDFVFRTEQRRKARAARENEPAR
jgi:sterol desaturase/sphingolipid hydroxylase (fatty acid hydroxylase superfamily)